jgi:hypothetical protein
MMAGCRYKSVFPFLWPGKTPPGGARRAIIKGGNETGEGADMCLCGGASTPCIRVGFPLSVVGIPEAVTSLPISMHTTSNRR